MGSEPRAMHVVTLLYKVLSVLYLPETQRLEQC